MFNVERWQEIFETIRKNKLRTFLTSLSVASGIFILVILLGFSTGIENGIRSQFEQDATNRISINVRSTTKGYKGLNPGRRLQLRDSDFENFNNKYADYIEHKTSIFTIWGTQVNYQAQQGNYRLEGIMPGQQFIENATMVVGRYISPQDVDESSKVAVIGYQMKEDLFKNEGLENKT